MFILAKIKFPAVSSFLRFFAQKTKKKHILTSILSAQHPNAGQNIQHLSQPNRPLAEEKNCLRHDFLAKMSPKNLTSFYLTSLEIIRVKVPYRQTTVQHSDSFSVFPKVWYSDHYSPNLFYE